MILLVGHSSAGPGHQITLARRRLAVEDVDVENELSAEQRLFDAAVRWTGAPHVGHKHLIDAAVQALVGGLDSPSLRELAGASPRSRSDEIRELLDAALDELSVPHPGTLEPWERVASGGQLYSRLPREVVRFEVAAVDDDGGGGFQLLVFVDDVEMSSKGAGLGMPPFDILLPANQLVAQTEPHQVPIARCGCGVYGCGSTDVQIVRDGDVVHWEWLIEAPMSHGVTFHAEQYDAEVERIARDHSWEHTEDTVTRLILQGADRDQLRDHGLTLHWAAADYRDPGQFVVCLMTVDGGFQVFLRFPFEGHPAEVVAADAMDTLRLAPHEWRAGFHAIRPHEKATPAIAGPAWSRERLGP